MDAIVRARLAPENAARLRAKTGRLDGRHHFVETSQHYGGRTFVCALLAVGAETEVDPQVNAAADCACPATRQQWGDEHSSSCAGRVRVHALAWSARRSAQWETQAINVSLQFDLVDAPLVGTDRYMDSGKPPRVPSEKVFAFLHETPNGASFKKTSRADDGRNLSLL